MKSFDKNGKNDLAIYCKIVFDMIEFICNKENSTFGDKSIMTQVTNSDGSVTTRTKKDIDYDFVGEFKKSISESIKINTLTALRSVYRELRLMARELSNEDKHQLNILLADRFGSNVPKIR